jgi:competence protein ComEC
VVSGNETAEGDRGWHLAGVWPARCFLAERERWPLWLPVAFGVGIAIYFSLAAEPPTWSGPAGVALTAAACLLGRRRTLPLIAALVTGAAALGFTAAQVRTAWVAAPVIEKRSGPMVVSGQVLQASPKDGGLRILLQRLTIPALAPQAVPQRVRVKLAVQSWEIRPGDWIRLRAVLLPPPEPAMPGAFDFARRSYFQRLGAVGFALGGATKSPPPADAGPGARWSLWWFGLRHGISQRVTAVLPGEAGAVATALMTGERGRIPEEILQDMRDSGLAHLLAISGLHMGLIAGLLFFGLRAGLALVPRLALYYPIKKWAALGAALGAFAYLFLAGATVPTQRAFLMVMVVLLAVVLDRRAVSLRLVAWAAFAVLLVGPEALLSVSFQMSFAAVVALVAGYEALRRHRGSFFANRGVPAKLGLYLAGVALTSVIATLATSPFAIYHFNRVAVFGLAANLVAVPLTGFWIMPWALAAFALMPLGLEGLALVPMSWGLELLIAVAGEIASWPGAVRLVPAMPLASLGLVVLGGLWLCLWSRAWRFAGLAAVLAGVVTATLVRPPDIWVGASGKPMGLRTPEGEMLLSNLRGGRFESEIWQRRAGATGARGWPEEGTSDDGRLSCDLLACIYRARGEVVALVRDPRALAEDCGAATVLVSQVPLRRVPCSAPKVVVDRFDLWRDGAVAVWLGAPNPRVETVRMYRGVRPWSPERGRD